MPPTYCRPVELHVELSEIKAVLVPPMLNVHDEDWEVWRMPQRHQGLPSLSGDLDPAEPKSVGLAQNALGHAQAA